MCSAGPLPSIAAVVVTHESSEVIGICLTALERAAPSRGMDIRVVDNASTDSSATIAAGLIGPQRVLRLDANRGFAAGVNAGLVAVPCPWIAVVNPDVIVPPGSLDRLAEVMERHPGAGLVAPRVIGPGERPEASVGWFPTVARERAHAWMLDRLLGREGRHTSFPTTNRVVDWASGCFWLLRSEAVRDVGAMDEGYFMYFEDVDYCRRLRDAGWDVLATPTVEVRHGLGRGSRATASLPADGGTALLRYFAKFHPGEEERLARRHLVRGWRIRQAWRRLRAFLGDAGSAVVAERYRLALRALDLS